jgi:hypothetical protein
MFYKESFEKKVGRFVSEYGFQALPDLRTLISILDTSQIWLDNPGLTNHQKHPFGMENLQNYALRYFGLNKDYLSLYKNPANIPELKSPAQDTDWQQVTKHEFIKITNVQPYDYAFASDFGCSKKAKISPMSDLGKRLQALENYIFITQLTQAYGIGMAIEAHRRAKPFCMGTLFWQLNDSWPAISWSVLDYYGRPKALFYKLKELYGTILISTVKSKDSVLIYATSDTNVAINALLKIDIYGLNGQKIDIITKNVSISDNKSQKIYALNLKPYDTTAIVLDIELIAKTKIIASRTAFLAYPKFLKLQKPRIKIKTQKTYNYYTITISTDKPVYSLWLKSNTDGYFDENFISLLPEKKYTVHFYPKNNSPSLFGYLLYAQ